MKNKWWKAVGTVFVGFFAVFAGQTIGDSIIGNITTIVGAILIVSGVPELFNRNISGFFKWEKGKHGVGEFKSESFKTVVPTENLIRRTDKWWYRLLQVIYVIFGITLVVAYLTVVVEAFPRLDESKSSYRVVCDNGTERNAWPFNYFGSELLNNYSDLPLSQNGFVIFACSRPDLADSEVSAAYAKNQTHLGIPDFKSSQIVTMTSVTSEEFFEKYPSERPNYHMVLKDPKYTSTWTVFFEVLLGGLFGITLALLVVRSVFLYVFFKESILRNMFPFPRR